MCICPLKKLHPRAESGFSSVERGGVHDSCLFRQIGFPLLIHAKVVSILNFRFHNLLKFVFLICNSIKPYLLPISLQFFFLDKLTCAWKVFLLKDIYKHVLSALSCVGLLPSKENQKQFVALRSHTRDSLNIAPHCHIPCKYGTGSLWSWSWKKVFLVGILFLRDHRKPLKGRETKIIFLEFFNLKEGTQHAKYLFSIEAVIMYFSALNCILMSYICLKS